MSLALYISLLGMVGLLLLWYLVAHFWADSVRHQDLMLRHEVATGLTRYGWRCPRCGRVMAPQCGHNGCSGALMWTQGKKKVLCGRCGRHFVAHPWLFREKPVAWPRRCNGCGWFGIVRRWETD